MGEWWDDLPDPREALSDPETFRAQAAVIRGQVEADPWAAAIPDDEAERFLATFWTLANVGPLYLQRLARAFGQHTRRVDQRTRNRVIGVAMRHWNHPRYRKLLQETLVPNSGYGRLPPAADAGGRITVEYLIQAYAEGINLAWLVRYLRNLGQGERVPEFLARLGRGAEAEYRYWLDLSRLMMSRLLGGRAQRQPQPEPRGEYRRLQQQLQAQETIGKVLQADMQRLERSRQDLVRAAERSEADSADLVQRARAEAAAARQELERRRQAHARELAEAEARHAGAIQALQRKIAQARQELAAALAERAAGCGVAPLRGLTVAVQGGGDPESYRLLIESAGGRLADGSADLTVRMQAVDEQPQAPGVFTTPEEGLAAFERVLHRQILPALARRRR